jgi:hypothetical protein
MSTSLAYFRSIEPAAKGLFKLLNGYGWQKMRAFVEMTKTSSVEEFAGKRAEFESVDTAREVISGSILQLAYFAIKRHAAPSEKSAGAQHFESEMNRLLREIPNPRTKQLELPPQFCVGRAIGDLPIGIIIYAGRNQYNHFDDDRLGVVNEVVFDYLRQVFPNPVNGHSFAVRGAGRPLSHSVLAALGWIDSSSGLGFEPFKKDLTDLLQIEA